MKPTGKVTFLFTDIEGSTKLSQHFPDTLQSALERHHLIVQNAIESNNGFVFEIIGDAFCCAFEKADDAVKAAVDAQLNLTNEKWDDAVIRVRIGIHTGNAEWNGKRYVGYITLARTARIMSVAHGGQIIISNNTYESCKHEFDVSEEENITLRDLGERRLKDVIQSIRLYQVLAKGLRENFPPVQTLDVRPNNLPVQLTSFIGRETSISEVKILFRKTHLLSLVGAGGSGKTRLALQVAADLIDEFANGVFIVELAPVSDPALVLHKIMNSIGIKEESGRTPHESLTNYLKDKEMLLILDNCEHLIIESAELAENILRSCRKMKILATSREALNCSGEQTYKIPMLSVPGSSDHSDHSDPDELYKYESSLLFIERAFSANPDFLLNEENTSALADICKHLDGIPLAIELAAASTRILNVESIRDRLDDRFKLLTGGKRTALPKQQTLKAMIDWSYELLSVKERLLWKRLSIFKGGWDLESAEEICSDDKIKKQDILELHGQLVEKSIINFDGKNDWYSILETIKKYGEDKLSEEGGINELLDRHLNYYMNYSEKVQQKLYGSEILLWLDKLQADHLNFQSALEWSSTGGDREKGARLAVSLWRFWDIRGHYSTGIKLLFNILEGVTDISKPVLGKAYICAAQFSRFQGDYELSRNYYNESLKINREQEDTLLIASSFNGLGNIEFDMGNYEKAKEYYEKALVLRKEEGDTLSISKSLNNLGNLAFRSNDHDEGERYYTKSLKLARKTGDKRGIANSLHNLSNLTFDRGEFEKGRQFSEESLELRKELGDKLGIAESLFNLGKAFFIQENYEKSQEFFEESLRYFTELEDKDDIAKTLNRLGELEFLKGNTKQAVKLLRDSRALAYQISNKALIAEALYELGNISYKQKRYNECRNLFIEYLKYRSETEDRHSISIVLMKLSVISGKDGFQLSSVKILGAAEAGISAMNIILKEDEIKHKEQVIKILKEQFGEEKFEEQFEEGKKLSLEEACQLIIDN